MVRVGPVHYNTVEEIERFGEALGRIASWECVKQQIISSGPESIRSTEKE